MVKTIISIEELKMFGRPIGKMVDDHKLHSFITEVEMLHIKPVLGDDLYLTLLDEDPNDERIKLLLEGGIYDTNTYGKEGGRRCFEGLKKTIAYYVYAENVMSGDFESTRFGMVTTNNNFSTHISRNYRSDLYNNVIDKAKGFFDDCITFCKVSGLIKEKGNSKISVGGCVIRKIG